MKEMKSSADNESTVWISNRFRSIHTKYVSCCFIKSPKPNYVRQQCLHSPPLFLLSGSPMEKWSRCIGRSLRMDQIIWPDSWWNWSFRLFADLCVQQRISAFLEKVAGGEKGSMTSWKSRFAAKTRRESLDTDYDYGVDQPWFSISERRFLRNCPTFSLWEWLNLSRISRKLELTFDRLIHLFEVLLISEHYNTNKYTQLCTKLVQCTI